MISSLLTALLEALISIGQVCKAATTYLEWRLAREKALADAASTLRDEPYPTGLP